MSTDPPGAAENAANRVVDPPPRRPETAHRERSTTLSPYPLLLSPAQLGSREVRNRIWMTAHATEFTRDGTYSDTHAAYYGERARHGVGVITMEATSVHPTSQPRGGVVLAYEESVVASYRKVADAVQPHGTRLLAQLWHRGRETDSLVSRHPVWAPSAVPCTVYREVPHEVTSEEIDELVDGYATSARYAVEGGLDGVEIHGLAHGYLLGQFLSPATNHRSDEYGGTPENRFRIVRRIIERVRAEVPADMILGIRINGDDGEFENSLRTDDWVRIAQAVEDTGMVDYVSVSQGTYLDRMRIYGVTPLPAGYEMAATAQVKAGLRELPVVGVGRISTPEMAESLLEAETVDFVGMARQLIADPAWPAKAAAGRPDDIRPCVGTNHCLSSIFRGPLSCIHNPDVGREAEAASRYRADPTGRLRVAVVGAGPAGLRAALTAAEEGHHVTVLEKANEPGGQVALMARAEAFAEWRGITDWLVSQLRDRGVAIRLGHEATADEVADGFDAVVVATGSTPRRDGWSALHPARWAPGAEAVPGVDQWNVYTAEEVLGSRERFPASVLIVDDVGDRRALAVAEHLADGRRAVEIATRLPHVGVGLSDSHDLPSVARRLRRRGVLMSADLELVRLEEDVATLADVYTGVEVRREPVDALVLVTGNRAEDGLLAQLKDRGVHAVAVGDCVAPRRIFDAIWEGDLAARRLTEQLPVLAQS